MATAIGWTWNVLRSLAVDVSTTFAHEWWLLPSVATVIALGVLISEVRKARKAN